MSTLFIERRAYQEVLSQLQALKLEQPHLFGGTQTFQAVRAHIDKMIVKTGLDADPLLRHEEVQVSTAVPDMEKIHLRNKVEELSTKIESLQLSHRLMQNERDELNATVQNMKHRVAMTDIDRDAMMKGFPLSPPTPSRPRVRAPVLKRRRVMSDGAGIWGELRKLREGEEEEEEEYEGNGE